MNIAIVLSLAIAQAASAVEKADKRVAELVAPAKAAMIAFASEPKIWRASVVVEDIAGPARPIAVVIVRLPQPSPKEAKPAALRENQPLAAFQDKTPKPKDVELPAKPLIRLPSLDVNSPLPIPILGQHQKDRASVGDPAL